MYFTLGEDASLEVGDIFMSVEPKRDYLARKYRKRSSKIRKPKKVKG